MEYQFCWAKCQRIAIEVCENRIKKGRCRVLEAPKDLTSEMRGFFGYEKGEVKVSCEEVR
jgi:hypothetical protein